MHNYVSVSFNGNFSKAFDFDFECALEKQAKSFEGNFQEPGTGSGAEILDLFSRAKRAPRISGNG